MRVAAVKARATDVALEITSGIFEGLGARATASTLGFDRFWRNVRTHTLHDPVAYKRREVGAFLLRDELPEPTWYSSPPASLAKRCRSQEQRTARSSRTGTRLTARAPAQEEPDELPVARSASMTAWASRAFEREAGRAAVARPATSSRMLQHRGRRSLASPP